MGLTAPGDLSEAERVVWDATAPGLDRLGVLDAVDAELLRTWCRTVVEVRAAEAWVAEHGTVMTLRDDKGNVTSTLQAPKYVQLRALRGDLVKLGDRLGLSPAARSRIGVVMSESAEVSVVDDLAARRSARVGDSAAS